MNKHRIRQILSLLLCLTALLSLSLSASAQSPNRITSGKPSSSPTLGYYQSESGVYAFSLAEGGYCYWYQNGIRFSGLWENAENGLTLRGHGL